MNITIEKALRTALYLTIASYLIHFLVFGFLVSPWDFDHLAGYYETAWRFWRTGSGLPHYNPYLCGGRSLGGDPQNFLYSPWTLAVPFFGAMWTIKLQMLFELALGGWGLKLLSEAFRFEERERLALYFFFLSGGAIVSRFTTGHVTLGFYFFYPLLIALSYRVMKLKDLLNRDALLFILLCVYGGNHKPNFFIYGLLPLLLESLVRAMKARSVLPLLLLGMGAGFSGAVNAVSLFPSARYFHDFPRHDFDEWLPVPFYTYFLNLLLPLRTIPNTWYGPRFLQRHEYNLFLGPVILWVSWLGLKPFRERFQSYFTPLLLASILCILIGFGTSSPDFSFTYPYTWFLKWWPGFSSVRVPPRFWILSAYFLTILAAYGTRFIDSRKKEILFIVFGVLPLLLSQAVNLGKTSVLASETQWSTPRASPAERFWFNNEVGSSYRYLRSGIGVMHCVENMQFEVNPLLRPGDSLSYQLSTPAEVSLAWTGWNKIQVHVQANHPVTMGLNLNPHPYWKFEGKGEVLPGRGGGPLSVFAKDGQVSGTLVFTQPMSIEGLITTLCALTVLAIYAAWVLILQRKIRVIGLTGGVASGKSVMAEALEQEGVPVFNMDLIGREVLELPSVIQSMTKLCGKEILKTDGSIDRMKMRVVLFSSLEQKKRIESVLHPAIWKEFYRRAKEEQKLGKKTVICEAALHIESQRLNRLDGLIVVLADEATRIERLMARDHITREFALEMLKHQTNDEERIRLATVTIENNGSREDFLRRCLELVRKMKRDGFI